MKKLVALLVALSTLMSDGTLHGSINVDTMNAGKPTPSDHEKTPFSKAVFVSRGSTPRMYLACEKPLAATGDTTRNPFQLARAEPALDADGNLTMSIVGFSLPNTFTNTGIGLMAIPQNGSAIFFTENTADALQVNVVTNPTLKAGEAVTIKASAKLKDVNGDIAPASLALAASNEHVFAVLPDLTYDWTFADMPVTRGVAILGTADCEQKDHNDLSKPGTKALLLNMSAAEANDNANAKANTLAVKPTNGAITHAFPMKTNVAMHWDDTFKRLYMGFNGMQGRKAADDARSPAGSVLGIGTVKMNTTETPATATFESILEKFSMTSFDIGENKYIVGAKAASADNISVSIPHVRTMHTSTGKDYLIVASTVSVENGTNSVSGVFALPLKKNDGRLAKHDNFEESPEDVNHLARADAPKACVALNIFSNQTITEKVDKIADIFVEGDSVYIAMQDGADNNSTRRGLFRSTALFDKDGAILCWTPGKRVGGNLGIVAGAGYDASTGTVYALTSESIDDYHSNTIAKKETNTIRASQWIVDDAANLNKIVAAKFPASTGGIHRMYAFDEATPGFASYHATDDSAKTGLSAQTNYDNAGFNMMVAMGRDNVALIGTGLGDTAAPNKFLPTDTFDDYVFDFPNDPVLQSIAPLACCEMSKQNTEAASTYMGYLFAGGSGGIALLAGAGNGAGSGTGFCNRTNTVNHKSGLAGLSKKTIGFPGSDTENYVFFNIMPQNGGDFTNTHKIACLGRKVYVMTDTAVYQIPLPGIGTGYAFSPPANRAATVPEVALNFAGTPLEHVSFTDCLALQFTGNNNPVDHTLLLGTTKGLFIVEVPDAYDGIAPVNASFVGTNRHVVANMTFIGMEKGPWNSKGNLFVLYGDPTSSSVSNNRIERFAVDTVQVTITDRVVLAGPATVGVNRFPLDEFRQDVAVDGETLYTTRNKHGNKPTSITGTVIRSSTNPTKPAGIAGLAQHAVQNANWETVGAPVVNPATGQILLVGTSGVISNQ